MKAINNQKNESMKTPKILTFIIWLFLLTTSSSVNAQYVFSTLEINGKTVRYPALKMEGSKWYYNSEGTQNPEWGITTNPFYINANGELFDGNQEKIGWYVGDDFYLRTGWVVLDNKKQYYKHKELIYNSSEVAFRFCSDQRAWLVSQDNNKTYQLQVWDKIDETRKSIITYDLVGLEMNKNTAVAIFELIKILSKDIAPCGFDEEDDRPELTLKVPETQKEKEKRESEQFINEVNEELAKWKEEDRLRDSAYNAQNDKEVAYKNEIIALKKYPLSTEENSIVGIWKLKSDIHVNINIPFLIREEIVLNSDRTFNHKVIFLTVNESYGSQNESEAEEYAETGVWEFSGSKLTLYADKINRKPVTKTNIVQFSTINTKKAEHYIQTSDYSYKRWTERPIIVKGKRYSD